MKTLFTQIFIIFTISISISQAQMVTTIAGPNSNINDALIMGDDGNIYGSYFSNTNNGAIYKITPDGNVSLFSDGYSACNGLDFDHEGYLYVVDFTSNINTHQIYKLDENGNKAAYGPNVQGASGIIFDPNSDTLYISSYNSNVNAILKMSPDGNVINYCNHSDLNGPVGMAFDDEGILYVANFTDGEIYTVSHGGDSLTLLANIPSSSWWGVGFITYASGYIYATGIGKHIVYQISLDGNVIEYAGTGQAGLEDGQAQTAKFNRPNGITTNAAQDTIYISDYTTQAIRMITETPVGISNLEWKQDKGFELFQNYPNPVKGTTTISYSIKKAAQIEIKLISSEGRIIKTWGSKYHQTAKYELEIDLSDMASGLYFYSLESNGIIESKKLMIK